MRRSGGHDAHLLDDPDVLEYGYAEDRPRIVRAIENTYSISRPTSASLISGTVRSARRTMSAVTLPVLTKRWARPWILKRNFGIASRSWSSLRTGGFFFSVTIGSGAESGTRRWSLPLPTWACV